MRNDGQDTGKRRDALRTKASILDAAIAEFALRGPAGTRVDEIATRAGVNKSLIYQYFGSKQELYSEALNAVLAAITEKSAEYSRALSDLMSFDDLHGYVRAYLENHMNLLEAVPEYPRLMAWENLEGGRTLARLPLKNTYGVFLARVRDALAPLKERGLLAEGFDLGHIAQAVMALTHYFVIHQGTLQHLFQTDPVSGATREAWLDFCAEMFLAVFRRDPK